MEKLYVDLDDTYVDTERYLRKVIAGYGLSAPKYSTVYELYDNKGYRPIFDKVFGNYSVIPKKQGVSENIKLLETEYEIVFCSYCTTEREKLAKQKFAEEMGKSIILCEGNDWSKSSVDMSDGILIDDKLEVLVASNAKRKLQMYNEYSFVKRVNNCPLVTDWFDITDLLMEVSADEELRELICFGVQRGSKGWLQEKYQ